MHHLVTLEVFTGWKPLVTLATLKSFLPGMSFGSLLTRNLHLYKMLWLLLFVTIFPYRHIFYIATKRNISVILRILLLWERFRSIFQNKTGLTNVLKVQTSEYNCYSSSVTFFFFVTPGTGHNNENNHQSNELDSQGSTTKKQWVSESCFRLPPPLGPIYYFVVFVMSLLQCCTPKGWSQLMNLCSILDHQIL